MMWSMVQSKHRDQAALQGAHSWPSGTSRSPVASEAGKQKLASTWKTPANDWLMLDGPTLLMPFLPHSKGILTASSWYASGVPHTWWQDLQTGIFGAVSATAGGTSVIVGKGGFHRPQQCSCKVVGGKFTTKWLKLRHRRRKTTYILVRCMSARELELAKLGQPWRLILFLPNDNCCHWPECQRGLRKASKLHLRKLLHLHKFTSHHGSGSILDCGVPRPCVTRTMSVSATPQTLVAGLLITRRGPR